MKAVALLAAFAASLLSACETTNLARNSTPPATIRQEFVLHSMTQDWEGTYLYGVGLTDLGFGHLGDRKGLTLTVDSGLSTIRFFYLSHRHGDDNLFHQTDVIYMEVNLRPNGKYTLHCDASDETARFTLIELSTKEAAATSVDVPLYIRPSPERSGPGFMPMFIPGHH